MKGLFDLGPESVYPYSYFAVNVRPPVTSTNWIAQAILTEKLFRTYYKEENTVTDTPPQVGDLIAVSYNARVLPSGDYVYDPRLRVQPEDESYPQRVPEGAEVTIVERADDPAKDPIGTVRQNPKDPGHIRIKTDGNLSWVRLTRRRTLWSYQGSSEVVAGWKKLSLTEAGKILDGLNPTPVFSGRVFQDITGDLWFEIQPDRFSVDPDWNKARERIGRASRVSELQLRGAYPSLVRRYDLEEK